MKALTLFLSGGWGQILPPGGFSILAPKWFGLGIWIFVTMFIIDFRVMNQNFSKIGPAGTVLGACKVGVPGLGRTFSAGIVRLSCFFQLPVWIICGKYSSIVVYKSYYSDCMHCWQMRAQEHNMAGDESRCCPASCRSGSVYALIQIYAIP